MQPSPSTAGKTSAATSSPGSPRQAPKWQSPAIDKIGVIANSRGDLALLNDKGNVISWNLPEADGKPVCHALYDAPWKTSFRLGLSDKETASGRRLEDTSHTLVSTWVNDTGKALEWAFMVGAPLTSDGRRPRRSDGGRFARLLTCEQGTVNASLDLRLCYGHRGEQPVQWALVREWSGFREYVAVAGDSMLSLSTNMDVKLDDGISMKGDLALKAGESAFVCITWNGLASPTTVEDVKNLLKRSEEGWLKWVQSLRIPDDESASLLRGCAIRLRGLGHRDGAFYAAASRSLPEDDPRENPKAVRCWDYLFVWLRDATLTALSLSSLGDRSSVEELIRWYKRLSGFAEEAEIMYRADGGDVAQLGEHTVDELGYRGATYRFGNGAGNQEQHDKTVYPLMCLYDEAKRGKFDLELTRGLAEQAVRAMYEPCCGIWEVRPPDGTQVVYSSAQILLGQALHYASKIFGMAGEAGLARKYREKAAEVKQWVYNCVQDGVIVAAPNLPVLDSSVLLAFLLGEDMFNPNDPGDRKLMIATVRAIDTPHTTPAPFKGLREGNGHFRYNPEEFGDGISPAKEGQFNCVTGWVAQIFLLLGMLGRADSVMQGLLEACNELGGWSEERMADGTHMGNVHQAYVFLVIIDYYLKRAEMVGAMERGSEAAAA